MRLKELKPVTNTSVGAEIGAIPFHFSHGLVFDLKRSGRSIDRSPLRRSVPARRRRALDVALTVAPDEPVADTNATKKRRETLYPFLDVSLEPAVFGAYAQERDEYASGRLPDKHSQKTAIGRLHADLADPQSALSAVFRELDDETSRERFVDDLAASRSVRELLVRSYMGLVQIAAGNRGAINLTHDERIQAGMFGEGNGLLTALDKFDPKLGIPFKKYALPMIKGAIQDSSVETRNVVAFPDSVRTIFSNAKKLDASYLERFGRLPTLDEMLKELVTDHHSDSHQKQILLMYRSLTDLDASFEFGKVTGEDSADSWWEPKVTNPDMLSKSTVPSAEEVVLFGVDREAQRLAQDREQAELSAYIDDAAAEILKEREKAILEAHRSGYSYKEIGEMLHMNPGTVNTALIRIRELLTSHLNGTDADSTTSTSNAAPASSRVPSRANLLKADRTDSAIAALDAQRREAFLDTLSPREREVATLLYGLDGGGVRSNAVVADMLGTSTGNVRKHAAITRRKMEKFLGEE